ncbi:signal transduction histidine kinase [Thermobacillus composti KWC4]|uniref:histidine kinase n=1 Tax=Thermobacillus composti (strain DSM 18247 / JCM 13945 / KWC4) TaxID=717605 RepID=L0EGQ3_THECK|nr:HAMP domain-containing sensor histidine kinase [Thermobacillus composti]AGA59448.1 signal transduction histidine kinase [Thermobacillus composti KWC4]
MRRKPRKLSGMLLRSYILFSLSLGVSFIVLLLFFVARTNARMPAEDMSPLQAHAIARPDQADIRTDAIEAVDGWVEILDEQLRILEVRGEKRDGAAAGYTERELNALFHDTDDNPFYASIAPFHTNDGERRYVLVRLPKQHVRTDVVLSEMTAANWNIFWIALAETGALFVLLFGLNVYVYSRLTAVRLTNPLGAIAAGIRSISDGRYHERLRVEANYELAQIQESFNKMAEKLEQAEADNRRMAESKQRMLVHISHDLRTPITTIRGYAEALQHGVIKDEAARQRTLSLIHGKTKLVSELIDDVFELAKLEVPDYPVAKTTCDLAEFTREMAVDHYDLFEEKGMVFECDIPADELPVPIHAKLLYRAISNLLANALKYNQPGTHVRLSLIDGPGEVRLEVADNGIGIPAELRARVFEAFVRGDAARKSDGGSGLGLTIARHIAEKHGGRLELDSGGRWTRFVLTLPKAGETAASMGGISAAERRR